MHLGRDLWYGARGLWKAPGFSSVALATLALGIGAATAVFSVADAVLLKPLPFADADRLVVVWESNAAVSRESSFAAPWNFREWQRQVRTLGAFAAIHDQHVNLTGDYIWGADSIITENTDGLRPLRPAPDELYQAA